MPRSPSNEARHVAQLATLADRVARGQSFRGVWWPDRNYRGRTEAPAVMSPAALLALVLVREPLLERPEVLEQRGRVHLALAGQLEQRVLPRLARAERQHLHVR